MATTDRFAVLNTRGCQFPFAVLDRQTNGVILRTSSMTSAQCEALRRNGKSDESRWLACRELKLRGHAA